MNIIIIISFIVIKTTIVTGININVIIIGVNATTNNIIIMATRTNVVIINLLLTSMVSTSFCLLVKDSSYFFCSTINLSSSTFISLSSSFSSLCNRAPCKKYSENALKTCNNINFFKLHFVETRRGFTEVVNEGVFLGYMYKGIYE